MQHASACHAYVHCGLLIAEQLTIVLEEFGPKNFGAIVSDNGGGCENGRKLTKEKYPHLAIQRYDWQL